MTDKYKEFRRTDTELWNKTRFFLGVIFLFPFRFIALTFLLVIYTIITNLCSIGHDFSKPLDGWRRLGFKISSKIFPRLCLVACGYFKLNWTINEDYDYSKWLGKDYVKPKFAVSTTSNHSAWTDLFIMNYREGGISFLSK